MSSRGAIPPGIACLDDYRAPAQAHLDPAAWAYLDGAAADAHTLRANRAAWEALPLWPRVLQPLAHAEAPAATLLGRPLPCPILVAPMAYQRLAHPDGELGTAHAAAAQGAGLVLSTQASTRLETVAQAIGSEPGRGPLWLQLYLQRDRGVTEDLVRRAEASGYEALVLTVDAPVHGARDAERRAGFRLPPGVSAVNLPAPAQPASLRELLAAAPTWDDVQWLAARTRLPVLLKGVLHPQDARQAVHSGAAGLVVSNHGGRTLDTAVATATALPRVADAVAGALPLLVDGGIRRGTDVLKALALGATAVLVGRPVLWALATAGALGVAHALRLLKDELDIALALCGCAGSDQAGPALLRPD